MQLLLTGNARRVIRGLLDRERHPPTAGIRITRPGEQDAKFSLHAVDVPGADDEVVDDQGARVFVGPRAAESLDGMVLDVTVKTSGRLRFVFGPRNEPEELHGGVGAAADDGQEGST